jgi:predicted porin
MKKSLIALAVLATAGVASAQSSVTLFGIVDATLLSATAAAWFFRQDPADQLRLQRLRLGFRGTEDLGGGMSASFWLEAGVTNDDGRGAATNTNNQATGGAVAGIGGGQGLTFNRRSTVSLAGGWGEVRLGRDYSPQFWNLTVFDPFGTNGVGTTQTLKSSLGGPVTVRASNSMGYFLPRNLGGFYGQIQYYLGENNQTGAATEDDGKGAGLRLGYAAGPVNVALAFSSTNYATGDIKTTNLGGQYDFGVAKLMAHYNRDRVSAPANVTQTGYLIGGLIPMGAGEIRLAYSRSKNNAAVSAKYQQVRHRLRAQPVQAYGSVHHVRSREQQRWRSPSPERRRDCSQRQVDRLRFRYPSQLLIASLALCQLCNQTGKAAFGRLFF